MIQNVLTLTAGNADNTDTWKQLYSTSISTTGFWKGTTPITVPSDKIMDVSKRTDIIWVWTQEELNPSDISDIGPTSNFVSSSQFEFYIWTAAIIKRYPYKQWQIHGTVLQYFRNSTSGYTSRRLISSTGGIYMMSNMDLTISGNTVTLPLNDATYIWNPTGTKYIEFHQYT